MKKWLLLALLFPSIAFAQNGGALVSGIVVLGSTGRPVAGATVTVCQLTDNGVPCTQTVNLFSDPLLTVPLANPTTTDGNGNVFAFAQPGAYHYTVTGQGVSNVGQPFSATVAGVGAGNVVSTGNNALTGNNTASNINNIIAVDGVKYTTLAAALADPVCLRGCTIDMRGNSSNTALALGAFDPGASNGSVTVLLGPYTYTTSGITLRNYLNLVGSTRGPTVIQSTSTTAPVFTMGGTAAVYSVNINALRVFCGAGNSAQTAFNIVAAANGGGLNYSNLTDVTVGGDGVHECGGNGILLDGSAGGSPPGINQLLNFTNVQAFRTAGGGPAFHLRGIGGQINCTNCEFDGNATRDTLPNVVIEDSSFAGFTAAYSIAFYETTIQRGGVGIQLRGVTGFVCDTCHFENVSGMVNAAVGQHYGNFGVSIRNSYCAVACGANSGSGYLVTMDSGSQVAFDDNTILGTPDNFYLGTLTYLEHRNLINGGSGALFAAPNSSLRIPVGIDSDSPGIKFASTAFSGVTAGAYQEVDVTWSTPFVDGSYAPVCSVYDATTGTTNPGLRFERLSGSSFLSPSGLKAVVFNGSGITLSGTLFCIAVHI